MVFIITVFVVVEVLLSIIMGSRASRVIKKEMKWIEDIRDQLGSSDEGVFDSIAKEQRNHRVIDYLATCAETGQQVNVADFSKLLSTKTEQAFEKINSVMNVLPIIGLMGTFLGIVIGINYIDLESGLGIEELSSIIQPLISAAGLAFISSLAALFCATILKAIFGVKRNRMNHVINDTENALLIDYIPHIAPKDTEDRFAKTVKKLDRSISGFVNNFQQSYSEFIAEFKPLVEDQKHTNAETVKAIENVSVKLAENTESLKQITSQQSNQTESLNTVITNISAASSSLEGSIEVASKSLQEFAKLGIEMKNSISEMHTPLKEIITGNAAVNVTINKLFKELPEYNQMVVQYLNALNTKLDTFREVGEKVQNVKAEFSVFSEHLGKMLTQFTADSEKFRLLMETNFRDYDTALRTAFHGIAEKNDIELFYYDPKAIKLLQELAAENGRLLSQVERATNSFDKSTENLLKAMNDLGFWGFFRRKKKEIKGRGK
ncbi:MAG: hypothetical protein PHR32_05640 [Candidatus Cloacimonetes bacterium]|jgi:biopolymer transport protein ExbB/TolQ|nr:hypothetical protein [Candidatus Cloacimonadota bacterium]